MNLREMENFLEFAYNGREASSEAGPRLSYSCSKLGVPDRKLSKWINLPKNKAPTMIIVGMCNLI